MIIIKKYSNRRLYNTEKKEYITLDELAQIIRGGQEIQVIDNEKNKDITSEILLQIIFQNFHGIFPSQFLHQLIRMQQQQLQEFFQVYLETGLECFSKFKQQLGEQANMISKFWMSNWPNFMADSEYANLSKKQPPTKENSDPTNHHTSPSDFVGENKLSRQQNLATYLDREAMEQRILVLEQELNFLRRAMEKK